VASSKQQINWEEVKESTEKLGNRQFLATAGAWPDCWVSAEFLQAPIPWKGSGSTTTTTIPSE